MYQVCLRKDSGECSWSGGRMYRSCMKVRSKVSGTNKERSHRKNKGSIASLVPHSYRKVEKPRVQVDRHPNGIDAMYHRSSRWQNQGGDLLSNSIELPSSSANEVGTDNNNIYNENVIISNDVFPIIEDAQDVISYKDIHRLTSSGLRESSKGANNYDIVKEFLVNILLVKFHS